MKPIILAFAITVALVIPSNANPVVVEDTGALEQDVKRCTGVLRINVVSTRTRNERRDILVHCLTVHGWNPAVAQDEAEIIVPRIGGAE